MMFKKYIILIIMFFVFITSFVAVYFALKYNDDVSKNTVSPNTAINTDIKNTLSATISLINENTEIVKNYKYKDDINKQYVEKPGPELLGLDREGARKYFKDKGFLLTEFSNKRVSLLIQSDTWAPNYYVVKSDEALIKVYQANEKGELVLEFKTEINPQELPQGDRKLFEVGKAFENIDSVNEMLDELNS